MQKQPNISSLALTSSQSQAMCRGTSTSHVKVKESFSFEVCVVQKIFLSMFVLLMFPLHYPFPETRHLTRYTVVIQMQNPSLAAVFGNCAQLS